MCQKVKKKHTKSNSVLQKMAKYLHNKKKHWKAKLELNDEPDKMVQQTKGKQIKNKTLYRNGKGTNNLLNLTTTLDLWLL